MTGQKRCFYKERVVGLGLWGITPLSTIFCYIVEASFIGGGNQSTPEKTTDLPQVTDKLNHIMVYRVHLA